MKLIKSLFHPNKIVGFLLCNSSIILLIYIFTKHLEDTPLAYIAYLLSTYSLIIFIIWFIKVCEFSSNFVKNNSKLYQQYDENKESITKLTFHFSLIVNLIYGIFKLTTGIYFKSAWFITFAIYYILLCFMKINLIPSLKKDTLNYNEKERISKTKTYRYCAITIRYCIIGNDSFNNSSKCNFYVSLNSNLYCSFIRPLFNYYCYN